MKCRHCGGTRFGPFVDLGAAPPSNAYLDAAALAQPETWYPLRVVVCHDCKLVQTEDHARPEALFTADYGYFSATSTSWLAHCEHHVAASVERFGFDAASFVVEVAANDGYLLQYVLARGIPCLGIEPTAGTAAAARARGVAIVERFFGTALAAELRANGPRADWMIANNVLAHVPDIGDFVAGFATLLADDGVASFEFPHLVQLVRGRQFDTVYHEHYSYLSLTAVARVFADRGLAIFDVEALPTHGGSLRVWAQRAATGTHLPTPAVAALLAAERVEGVCDLDWYAGFQRQAERVKDDFVAWLLEAKRTGKRVAAYGAAAKGNTLLNYAGVRGDLIAFVVDRSPGKQGRWMPGSRIPIVAEDRLREARPDAIVLLPWNLRDELIAQLAYARDWGAQFVRAVPQLVIE
jgi:hypothetical protein